MTCSRASFPPPHLFFFLIAIPLYWHPAQTANISPKCTRSSLSKTSVNKIYEGVQFNFSIEAFKYGCETSPCTEALECSLICGQCAHYSGAPSLSFNLVNKLTGSVLPNVTCQVGSASTGMYPISCRVTNSMASNSTLYRMDILSVENPAVPDRLGETPATMVLLPGSVSVNHSVGSWINGINVFKATSKAKLYVHLRDAYNNWIYGASIQNQKLIGKVRKETDTETIIYQASLIADVKAGYQLFEYKTTTPGNYLLHVVDPEGATLLKSPFKFNITAGDIYVPNCLLDWDEGNTTFKAGQVASLFILIKDVYNNTFSTENGRSDFFQFSVISNSSEFANLSVSSESDSGHEIIQFVPFTAGRLFLQVGNVDDTQITGSPFALYVVPAALSISSCTAEWVNGNLFLAGSSASFKIILRDKYKNMLNSTLKNQNTTGFSMILYSIGSIQRMIPTKFSVTSGLGYELVHFVPYIVGNFKIWIGKDNIAISNSTLKFSVVSATVSIAQCRASWHNGISKFRAGNDAAINISLHDAYGNNIRTKINASTLQFSLRVNGRKGESIYISNIAILMNHGNISITFMPCLVGVFSLQVENNGEEIQNSPLSFTVYPGNISIHASLGLWYDGVNRSKPDEVLKLNILIRDMFGNPVLSPTNKTVSGLFTPKLVNDQGQDTENLTFNIGLTNVPGTIVLSFSTRKAGKQWLQVGRHGNQSEFLFNAPLSFFVEDGPLSFQHTYAEWKYRVNIFPPNKGVKLYVFQKDKWGNSVGALANLQVIIYRGDETIPSPYADIWFQAAEGSGKGTQLITFTTTAAGIFSLYIEDVSGNRISGCPYNFSVLATYMVQENKSLIYGLGLNPSVVGHLSTFFIQLKDIDGQNVEGYSQTVSAIVDPESEDEMKVIGTRVLDKVGLYKISITLNKSGEHDMLLLYCNVPLNSSRQIKKVVYAVAGYSTAILNILPPDDSDDHHKYSPGQYPAGNVSIADTVVAATDGLKYHPLILVPLTIVILLKDKYGNPVPGQASVLSIQFTGHKRSPEFSSFQEMETGNYTISYRAFEIAPMNISVYYRGNITIPGFPFYCYTHSSGWFPLPKPDISWTWEDTTAIINVLDNDYFRHKPGLLQGVQKQPTNGVAFVKGQSLAYVPRKGFLGNDSFLYKTYDAYIDPSFPNYVHTAIGFVTIFVVKHPPEIISRPKPLEVCQEQSLNIGSGDKKFKIYYSKTSSSVSYGQVFSKHGLIRTMENLGLSWKPSDSLSYMQIHHPILDSRDVDLEGVDDTINSALRTLIYIGAPDFHGLDKIIFTIKDEAGIGDEASVIVKVNQVNSPPYVLSYPYILVDAQTGEFLAGIDYDGKETYNKSLIIIMDNDIEDDVTGVEVLVKVDIGSLTITLPENSTQNTEVMQEESYHWSPLPTAMIANGFFSVEARSIKFRATLKECNEALTTLQYNGTFDDVSFTITINDLGNYGMDKNCSSKNPYPLSVEKDLTLVFSAPRLSQSYWKKTILRTKVVVIFSGIVTFSFMGVMIFLLCSLTTHGKKSLQKIKAYLIEENEMDSSCVYNPMWIPSAPSSPKQEFSITSNPHHIQLQKHILNEGLSQANEQMKTLLASQIKKNLTSIKSIKGLSFKARNRKVKAPFFKDLQET